MRSTRKGSSRRSTILAYDPAFDALAYIVEAGHRAGLEVHAWVNAMPMWRDEAPPTGSTACVQPARAFGRRRRQLVDRRRPTGEPKFPVGYFVDPGHPGVAAYLAEIYLNIVRNYAVDGIHFDYIRYPETEDRLPRGARSDTTR